MTRAPHPVLALGLALTLTACHDDPTGPGGPVPLIDGLPRSLSASEVAVIEGSNRFAFDLLRAVVGRDAAANIFLSPLSASMALGMALNGADAATWSQMRDMLGFGGLEEPAIDEAYRDLIPLLLGLDPSVELGLGNSVWAREGVSFHADFLDRVRTYFSAEARELDFADPGAMDVINAWVKELTRGRIEELLEEIPAEAIMYLINAVYFNGDWRRTFDRDRTGPAPFMLAEGSTVQVEMMEGEIGYRILRTADGAVGVELPYGGDAFAAVAVLPPPGRPITDYVAGLGPGVWAEWMANFARDAEHEDPGREGVLVRFPKLELEYGRTLNDDLKALGMTDAFDTVRADLTRLTPLDLPSGEGPPWVFVSEVKQKTFLKVDERGTEAAAATSVGIVSLSTAPQGIVFDRPFLFAIRERYSGTILFLGVIGDPGA